MNLVNQKKEYLELILNPTERNIEQLSYRYTLFCANIKKFLPLINPKEYYKMFQDLLYYQYSSDIEQNSLDYLDASKIINRSNINLDNYKNEHPIIFATFHLGSYRLINSLLYEKGFKIALIIDESVFASQLTKFTDTLNNVLRPKENSDLVILNVNDRTSIFKLKQLISEGYVMSVYLDGNKSINNKKQDFSKGYIKIPFLNNKIFVKNGVGMLAKFLNAKIVPVVAYRDDLDTNFIEFGSEISINDYKSKEEFSIKSIELCYKKLEEKLILYPTQWECWLYIHDWFIRDFNVPYSNIKNLKKEFNTERYNTFIVKECYFIFDLYSYQSFPIEKKLFEALKNNKYDDIEINLQNELIQKNILI